MQIRPRLFDWDNLNGPQWVEPTLSAPEVSALVEATVMFIGHDPATPNRADVLGSGFLVGVADTLIVATASHIFTWWADKLLPAPPHALKGLTGDRAEVMNRVQAVINERRIVACVNPIGTNRGAMLPIVGLAINSNPRDLDLGFVQLALPQDGDGMGFRTIPIDADPLSFHEPVLMVGYVGGGREYSIGERPFDAGVYDFKIGVRAGRIGELADKPDGHKYPMYRVNIPSLPSMSGGPLIALRPVRGLSLLTAVGAVSSSRLGSPILLDHCHDGETWVSPIALSLGRRVSIDGTPTTIADAIRTGAIRSYGTVAGGFEFPRTETDGVALVTFGVRNDSPDEN